LSRPLIVSIPHRLGREEAARRIKSGLTAARANYSALLTIHEETWSGDRLAFNLSALGQSAVGFIDVAPGSAAAMALGGGGGEAHARDPQGRHADAGEEVTGFPAPGRSGSDEALLQGSG
jgi:hypothetical protein